MEADKGFLQPVRSFTTGDAPSAAFVLVELHRAKGEFYDALLVVNNYHAARTEHRSGLRDRIEIHGDINFIRSKNGTGRSARHHALQLATVGDAAAHVVQHLLQVVAHGQFVHAGLGDVTAEAEQARAAVFRSAQLGIPVGAAKNNVRDVGQRFGIINDRRPAPQTDNGRKGWTDTRNATLAFERFHQRRLFADLVGSGAAVPVD